MDEHYALHTVFKVLFALLVASIVLGVLFDLVQGNFYMNGLWNIVGLLFALWFISWLLRWPMRREWHYDHEISILRRRYARGEISETQYRRMLKVLEKKEDLGKVRPRRKRR